MADDYLREKPVSYDGYHVIAVTTGDPVKDCALRDMMTAGLPGANISIKPAELPCVSWGNKYDQTDDINTRVRLWREEIMSEERAGHQHDMARPVSSKSLTIHGLNGSVDVSERLDRNGIELELFDELGGSRGSVHLTHAAWDALSQARYSLESEPEGKVN